MLCSGVVLLSDSSEQHRIRNLTVQNIIIVIIKSQMFKWANVIRQLCIKIEEMCQKLKSRLQDMYVFLDELSEEGQTSRNVQGARFPQAFQHPQFFCTTFLKILFAVFVSLGFLSCVCYLIFLPGTFPLTREKKMISQPINGWCMSEALGENPA